VGILTTQPKAGASQPIGTIATAPLILPIDLPEPIPEISIEIRDVAERRLVACIEVLSPTNKRGPGREEYEAKRLGILSGLAHLLEIDLLRVGNRFPTGKPLPPVPYFVFLSRAGKRKEVEVWPMSLEKSLPEVPVPLLPGDPDILLNLQQALQTVYNIFGYDELINYEQPPPGPFLPDEMAWVKEQLLKRPKKGTEP
jgi:hypothetical protein